MQGMILVTVMALTVEALVEYGRTAAETIHGGDRTTAILQGAAIAVSVAICLCSGADIYGALGIDFHLPPVGGVLTGIFAARGANYVSDLVGRLRVLPGQDA